MILPVSGRHAPTSARARVDLPDPLGPITPRAMPASRLNSIPCAVIRGMPGGAIVTASTTNLDDGAGRGIGDLLVGRDVNIRLNRFQLWRAATKLRQWAIARSTGASARPARIEPAIMMPAVASPLMTSQAPTPSIADWSINRRDRAKLLNPPEMSLTCC